MESKHRRKGMLGYIRRPPDGCAIVLLVLVAIAVIAVIAAAIK